MTSTSLLQRLTFLLLWLTIFTTPWQQSLSISGFGSVNKLFGIALIIVALLTIAIRMKFHRGGVKKPPAVFIMVYFFLAWSCLSWFWSFDQDGTISKGFILVQLSLLAWIIYEFSDSTKHIYSLFQAYVLGAAVLCFLTIRNYMTADFGEFQSRFFLDGTNPNDVGYTLAIAIPLAWFLGLNRSKLYLLYLPLSIYAILLTASRSAFMVTIFIVVSILWFILRNPVKYKKLIFIALIPLLWVVYKEAPQSAIDRLSTIQNEVSTGTLSDRTIIWESGISSFKEHPFIGVGVGAFGAGTLDFSGLGQAMNAHNTYLSILVEYGILGVVLFLIVCLVVFRTSWRIGDPKIRWLCLTLCIAWFIISIVKHAEAQRYTWMIFAFVLAISYLMNKSTKTVVKTS